MEPKNNNLEYEELENGLLQFEFHNPNTDFGKLSDTTRLIINPTPSTLAGQSVYNCCVSYYSLMNDCCRINEKTGKFESPRATQYKKILAQINPDLLKTDSEYCTMVMQYLLDENRVNNYLNMGLQDNPTKPCGNYIGGVIKTTDGYCKGFSDKVGLASHNSPAMQKAREDYKAVKKAVKKSQIQDLEEQLKKAKEGVDY